ncbi:hypothetical protein [Gorillibacterium massiliense]|uniref:hypothetical protein n=1 Tax=Gorillibacterium massiliense TaxID=1280390 RepID=UPI0012DD9665|nr:hypothetical protein [Gorillibacterium massiliense]
MFITLAIFGGIVGLLIIAAAVYTALSIRKGRSDTAQSGRFPEGTRLHWTVLDYGLLFLLAFAVLFLFVDLVAVLRDSRPYPAFHIGYLISGFVFVLLHAGFLYIRLLLVLRASRPKGAVVIEEGTEPKEAYQSK